VFDTSPLSGIEAFGAAVNSCEVPPAHAGWLAHAASSQSALPLPSSSPAASQISRGASSVGS
jgi:hypothetical protein